MLKKTLKFAGALAMVGILTVPMIAPSFAQDGGELSEEEQALLDRVMAAIEATEGLPSLAIADDETLSMELNLSMAGQELAMTQSTHKASEGYILRDGETENFSGSFTLEVAEDGPDGAVAYAISGDLIFVDGAAYVDAAYDSAEGDVEELAEGPIMITTAEEIPAALEELDLDDLFDEEDEDDLEQFAELTSYAVAVELSEDELEDGTPVELIAITLDQEGFAAFLASTAEEGDEAMMGMFTAEGAESELILLIALDENENIAYIVMSLTFSVVDLDAAVLDESMAGATLSVTMEGLFAVGYAGHGEEFDPIEVPELEGEAE